MKTPSRSGDAAIRVAWLLVLACTAGAYAGIVSPAEARLHAALFRARELYDLTERTNRLRGEAGKLSQARARVESDIAKFPRASAPAALALASLHLLARESRRRGIAIAGMVPGSDASSSHAANVTIDVRGRYDAALQTIADLSSSDVPLEVVAVRLTRSTAGALPQDVDASVDVVLHYDAADPSEVRPPNAPAAER